MIIFLRTSAFKESLLAVLVMVALGLSGTYVPSLMFVVPLFWAVPLIVVLVRHGVSVGFYTAALVGLILLLLIGPVQALTLLLLFSGVAFVYGFTFRKGIKPGFSILLGTVAIVFSFLLVILFLHYYFEYDPLYFVRQIQVNIDPLIEKYRAEGLFNSGNLYLTEEAVRRQLEELIVLVKRLFPALYILWGAFLAISNYLFARAVLKGLTVKIPPFLPLLAWRLPWWIIWGFIGGYGAYLAGDYFKVDILSAVGQNIMFLYLPVLFVLGWAVLSFFLQRFISTKGLRFSILGLFLLLFGVMSVPIVAGVGLLDLLFNYRRLTK